MQRIQKIISSSGYCSRRKAEELIKQGRVQVNGQLTTLGSSADEKDKITVDGKLLKRERKVYLLLNKPRGCVTAAEDKHCKTVMSYVRVKERVFPVGRLDFNTTGALILTNDGDFANKIMHPRYELKKTYLAEIDQPIAYGIVRRLERGIELTDGKTSPAQIKVLDPRIIEITLHEGRNHIVKRMFEHFGYRVRSLMRMKIGKVSLGALRPGCFRHLTEKEVEMLEEKSTQYGVMSA